jgi:hypothetical protein
MVSNDLEKAHEKAALLKQKQIDPTLTLNFASIS